MFGSECGICKSKNHCAELCEQDKSITKLHKVTTMTASAEGLGSFCKPVMCHLMEVLNWELCGICAAQMTILPLRKLKNWLWKEDKLF